MDAITCEVGALVLATTFCGGTRSTRLAFDSVVGGWVRIDITGEPETSCVGVEPAKLLGVLGVGAGELLEGGTGLG
jgi:hypothetical protein